jgi:hypothetical protein
MVGGGYVKRDYRDCDFRQELLYNGISKKTIRMTYREYKNDMARPAFFQDLTYDLDQSSTIRFRSFKIEVLEANNSFIRFVVIEEGAPKGDVRREIF